MSILLSPETVVPGATGGKDLALSPAGKSPAWSSGLSMSFKGCLLFLLLAILGKSSVAAPTLQ